MLLQVRADAYVFHPPTALPKIQIDPSFCLNHLSIHQHRGCSHNWQRGCWLLATALSSSLSNQSEQTLKTLRQGLQISQEELGRRMSLSYRTIAGWESSRNVPRFDNAIALARELEVSLKTLAKSGNVLHLWIWERIV